MPDFRVAWHHRVIAERLEALRRGEILRLIVSLPPRHSKSEMATRRFPAYCLGRDPDEQVIACSYNDDTAKEFNRDVQRIMLDDRHIAAFPDARLNSRNVATRSDFAHQRNARVFEIVGRRGRYQAAGVGGSITGKGATIALIDDPFKNHEEAYSATYRERVWNWYTSTLYTRGEGKFARGGDVRIAIVMTRWHEDDLVGRLLKREPEEWTVVRLPAVLEGQPEEYDPRAEGEALWPEKYDRAQLDKIKRLSARDWAALFQQSPTSDGGNMFRRVWWRRFDVAPDCTSYLQSWDMAFKDAKSSSYVVGQVWGVKRGAFYLLDQVRGQWGFTETCRQVQILSKRWPQAARKLVEDKANGPAVIDALREKIMGLVPVTPRGSKEARAAAVTPLVEAGNVLIPEQAGWVDAFLDEHDAFPLGAHDDQVDALTQALTHGRTTSVTMYERLTAAM